MFVYDWESHLSQGLPLLWLFTHDEDERINLAIIRQPDGIFHFYEGEDGKLFPTMATIVRIAGDRISTGHTLELPEAVPPVTLEVFGDHFMEFRGFFWTMTDPSGYDFEQIDESMIVMTTRS